MTTLNAEDHVRIRQLTYRLRNRKISQGQFSRAIMKIQKRAIKRDSKAIYKMNRLALVRRCDEKLANPWRRLRG